MKNFYFAILRGAPLYKRELFYLLKTYFDQMSKTSMLIRRCLSLNFYFKQIRVQAKASQGPCHYPFGVPQVP